MGPLLNNLSAKLDTPTMARLNASVDVSRKSFSEVAREFLKQAGQL
ncbi:MAG: glycine betaine ABC transporter substrate-binding protein [Burkholderiales bacterium]